MPIPDERESSVREFNELYFTYRSNFISIARSYVEETAVAEDIVTDSFVAYWVRRHELAADTDPRRYVVGAIKKRCLEHLRNKQIHQRVEKKLQDASDRMLEYHLWEASNAANPNSSMPTRCWPFCRSGWTRCPNSPVRSSSPAAPKS